MSLETAYFLLKIAGSLLVIELSVIAFFLVPFFKSVNKLAITVAKFEEWFDNHEKTHNVIDIRLNEHSQNINKHETAIEVLKAKKQPA